VNVRTLLAYSGSRGDSEIEPLEVAGPGPVEGSAGPPGIQPDQVHRGGGIVLQAGFVQPELAGTADAGDVGGLAHGALTPGAEVVPGLALLAGLTGAGGREGLVDLAWAQG
jgi:hypothetical protein